jgi:transcriptional regulator with XRE-family HTH domain
MLQVIDAERERMGLSVSELAEMIGTSPSSLRRLLGAPLENSTFRLLMGLFEALNVEVELHARVAESHAGVSQSEPAATLEVGAR